jgi:hypothetical protein
LVSSGFTPLASSRTSTSPVAGSGRGISRAMKSPPASFTRRARMVFEEGVMVKVVGELRWLQFWSCASE